MFDQYGRTEGYGQMAPGRDVPQAKARRRTAGPDIGAAIGGVPPSGVPVGGAQTPFNGAQQTLTSGPLQVDQQIPPASAPMATQGPDRSKWNTDGFAVPNQVAQSFGNAFSGYDQGKWSDPNHQTPKYVSARFQAEAGDQKDAANRQKYLDAMKNAYGEANFRFNGKDKISIDGGKSFVDVWGGAGAGLYTPAWQDESSQAAGGIPPGMLQQTILGAQPTVDPGSGVNMREQIMKALQLDPRFAGLAQGYGF
jgi:hypothetical protein